MKTLLSVVVASLTVLSACNPGPSADCVKYLKCTEAAAPGTAAVLKSTYDTGGTCWTSNTATADACTAACKAANTALVAGAGSTKAECK
jgi:hypothetical protein